MIDIVVVVLLSSDRINKIYDSYVCRRIWGF